MLQAIGFAIAIACLAPASLPPRQPPIVYGPQRFLEGGWDFHGQWRCLRVELDSDLSLAARDGDVVRAMEVEALDFQQPGFDDSGWPLVDVPGVAAEPPEQYEGGLLYRTRFEADPGAAGRLLLRFEGAGYLTDVWLNGRWLGYHEGEFTPFTFDITDDLRPENLLAVRVHIIPWESRQDIIPYAGCDFWHYGGILRDVRLARVPEAHIAGVRALSAATDSFDLRLSLRSGAARPLGEELVVSAYGPYDGGDPYLAGPMPAPPTGAPVAMARQAVTLAPGASIEMLLDLGIPGAEPWTPERPRLYLLVVRLGDDELRLVSGLRTLEASEGQLLLNGEPTRVWGAARHEEMPGTWRASTWEDWDRVRADLTRLRDLGCTFLRAGHYPNHPMVAMICDRLGLALWEEIPFYWFGGPQFEAALERGIAQAMWRELIRRDGSSPSLWFLGAANESGWYHERIDFLTELRGIAHEMDGTRLVGQSAVGEDADDATHVACDFVGMTCYYGIFYRHDLGAYEGTRRALVAAAEAFPDKPIIVAEFGAWAEGDDGEEWQRGILEDTLRAMMENEQVAAGCWWTAYDYASPHQENHPPFHYFGLWDWERETLRPAGEAYAEMLSQR